MICGAGPLRPCAEAAWLIFCCLSGAISFQRLLAKQGSPITWEPSTPTTFVTAKVVGKNQSIIYSLTVALFPWSSLQSSEDPLLSPAFPGYWSWAALLFWNILPLLFLQARLHSPSPVVCTWAWDYPQAPGAPLLKVKWPLNCLADLVFLEERSSCLDGDRPISRRFLNVQKENVKAISVDRISADTSHCGFWGLSWVGILSLPFIHLCNQASAHVLGNLTYLCPGYYEHFLGLILNSNLFVQIVGWRLACGG